MPFSDLGMCELLTDQGHPEKGVGELRTGGSTTIRKPNDIKVTDWKTTATATVRT
jgi:hypothetical protein